MKLTKQQGVSVDELLETTTPQQLQIWQAFWRLEQENPSLTDWQLALVAREIRALQMTVVSLVRKVRDDLPDLKEFMVKFEEKPGASGLETRKRTWQQKKEMLIAGYGLVWHYQQEQRVKRGK